MLLYGIFYKTYGVRKPQQLIYPRLFEWDQLALPRSSIIHYIGQSGEVGPDPKDPMFSNYKKRIPMVHVGQLSQISPGGRALSKRIQQWSTKYHKLNPLFKYQPYAIDQFRDPLIPIVMNYSLLPRLHRYIETPLTQYNQWRDLYQTVFDKAQQLSTQIERQQFIILDVPASVPLLSHFRLYEAKVNLGFLNVFNTPEHYMVMEWWKWLSDEHPSILNQVTTGTNKVNVIWRFGSLWALMNLGTLELWKLSNETQAAVKWSPVQYQKLFLKGLMKLKSIDSEPEEPIDPDDTPTASLAPGLTIQATTQSPNAATTTKHVSKLIEKASVDFDDTPDTEDFASLYDEIDEEYRQAENREISMPKMNYRTMTSGSIPTSGIQQTSSVEVDETYESKEELLASVHYRVDTNDALDVVFEHYLGYGVMTPGDAKTLEKAIAHSKNLPSPYDPEQTVAEYVKIPPEVLVLKEKPFENLHHVPDVSMHQSRLTEFDRTYVNQVMKKDMVSMVDSIKRSGIIILDHSVEPESTLLGESETHVLKLKPIYGAPSTIRIKLPVVNEEGEFHMNGNKYYERKQRGDLPIRKINPYTVALTSYYGKFFVVRNEKLRFSPDEYLAKTIRAKAFDPNDSTVTRFQPGPAFDHLVKLPRLYTGLAKHFRTITGPDFELSFDYHARDQLFPSIPLASIEAHGILVGTRRNMPIVLDAKDQFQLLTPKGLVSLGDLVALFDLDPSKVPVEHTALKIFRKLISLGFVFGYFYGLERLLVMLDLKPRRLPPRVPLNLQPYEWVLRFKDVRLVFDRRQREASLLIGGFQEYQSAIVRYSMREFESPVTYAMILENRGIGSRYVRELDMLVELFIDPITLSILKDRNEPVTFLGLLLRSNQLLLDDYHKRAQDLSEMRIKGCERIPGMVYTQLVKSVRDFKSRNLRGKSKIEMSPYAVWSEINDDSAKQLVQEINPIETIKQYESVTYVGVGGRSKESMSRSTRVFDETDLGTISEATVDSGDTGVNFSTSASPLLTSVRGLTEPLDYNKHGPANWMSTSAMLSVGANHDDGKRVNFVSIMASHVIPVVGYHQPWVRTGYEEIVPYRTGSTFAYIAKAPGKVIQKQEDGIIVEYQDGSRKGFATGIIPGKSQETTYPHRIVTPLDVNQTFEPGDPIVYHSGFFEPDYLNPKKIVWKSSKTVKVALYESYQTFDDSSAISQSLAREVETQILKVKSFTVNFNQGILKPVKVGQTVYPDTTLFYIEDEITQGNAYFDEETTQALQRLAQKSPKAKTKGVVHSIEVFYFGELEEMSDSLRALAKASNVVLKKKRQSTGQPVITGKVTADYRVEGTPLLKNSAEIRVSILVNDIAGIGDKLIFASQLKSVIAEVMESPIVTENQIPVEAVFGFKSIYSRVVLSPFIMGTTNTLLDVIGERAVALYRKRNSRG